MQFYFCKENTGVASALGHLGLGFLDHECGILLVLAGCSWVTGE